MAHDVDGGDHLTERQRKWFASVEGEPAGENRQVDRGLGGDRADLPRNETPRARVKVAAASGHELRPSTTRASSCPRGV